MKTRFLGSVKGKLPPPAPKPAPAPLDPHTDGPSGRATPVPSRPSADPRPEIVYDMKFEDVCLALMWIEGFNEQRASEAVLSAVHDLDHPAEANLPMWHGAAVIRGSGGWHRYYLRQDAVYPHHYKLTFSAYHVTARNTREVVDLVEGLGIEMV